MPLDQRGLYAPADFSALRSNRFDAPRVNAGVRARRAALRAPALDKAGREYPARSQALLGNGFHDAREAERLLLETADALGADHAGIEIEGRHWLETEIQAGSERAARPCPPCRPRHPRTAAAARRSAAAGKDGRDD